MEKHAMCKQGDDLKLSLFSELPPQYFFFFPGVGKGFCVWFFCLSVCFSHFTKMGCFEISEQKGAAVRL